VGKSVINARRARIIRVGELDAGRQGGGDDVTVTAQPAVRALMGALGQGFGHPRPTQAMLGQRGGSGAGAKQPAAGGFAFVFEAATSMPGLNSAIRLPHNLAQVAIEQSSTVIELPWVATIRPATWRARACLAELAARAAVA
jgi:hypothetical protein